MRRLLLATAVAALVVSPARATTRGAVLHEPIPPDAREDLAMHVSLDGDLPAALQTPSGVVSAPDPRAPPTSLDRAYSARADADVFQPDRDTRRPESSAYDEPFTPSTAPYKRDEAFDAVREDYSLYVRDTRLAVVSPGATPGPEDEEFYADLVVDVPPSAHVRIPTVGPGARVVRARLGVGAEELPYVIERDGADRWFVRAPTVTTPLRARLVMEITIARATFGGQMGDPSWSDLPMVPPLPDNVSRDAAVVRAAIGVSRGMRPREATAKLVQYFRGFVDSDAPPPPLANVYLDLALSKKGVCRHRAFVFLVTALGLGLPTRMVHNEAHAWVEVNDGTLWRRIDLGGAGRFEGDAASALRGRPVYRPPPDAFAWPPNAQRGDDMAAEARARAEAGGGGSVGGPADAGAASTVAPAPSASTAIGPTTEKDDRPSSVVTLAVDELDPRRGLPLHLRGAVRADGEPCAHVPVEIRLHDPLSGRTTLLGTLATGDDGTFAGGLVVSGSTPLGDYDVVARTSGDARCGGGGSD